MASVIIDDWNLNFTDEADYISKKALDEINFELVKRNRPIIGNHRPTDEETRAHVLGAIGEKLVRWYLTILDNAKITESMDPLDSEKDFTFTLTGKTAEVKTQSPYYNLNAFAVKQDQLKKLRSVDYVYFLETPRHMNYPSLKWNYNARESFRTAPEEQRQASDYGCTLYVWTKAVRDINEILENKKVFESNGNSRQMLLVPINKLSEKLKITDPKHLILLDKFSTNPIGLV